MFDEFETHALISAKINLLSYIKVGFDTYWKNPPKDWVVFGPHVDQVIRQIFHDPQKGSSGMCCIIDGSNHPRVKAADDVSYKNARMVFPWRYHDRENNFNDISVDAAIPLYKAIDMYHWTFTYMQLDRGFVDRPYYCSKGYLHISPAQLENVCPNTKFSWMEG